MNSNTNKTACFLQEILLFKLKNITLVVLYAQIDLSRVSSINDH